MKQGSRRGAIKDSNGRIICFAKCGSFSATCEEFNYRYKLFRFIITETIQLTLICKANNGSMSSTEL